METSRKCSKVYSPNNLRIHFFYFRTHVKELLTSIYLGLITLILMRNGSKCNPFLVLASRFLNEAFEPSELFDLSNRT